MAIKTPSKNSLNLSGFRRRILLVRVWYNAAAGGIAGVVVAIVVLGADRLDIVDVSSILFVYLIGFGMVMGVIGALSSLPSDAEIARSIDRRSQLEDRLTTVYELGLSDPDSGFLAATEADSIPLFAALDANKIYPLRFRDVHAIFAGLLLFFCALYLVLDTTTLLSPSAKLQALQMKQAAQQVQAVARPWLEQADKPGASAADKQLAVDIRHYIHDLNKGRLTQQEALIRGNQLADEARQLEQQRSQTLGSTISAAESAGQRLGDMMQNASAMQQSEESKLSAQADALRQQISSLQNMLSAANSAGSHATKAAKTKLAEELADLQKQLQQIEISERAAAMLAALQQLPDYQEAMAIMAKKQQLAEAMSLLQQLEQNNSLSQAGQDSQSGQTPLTADQMKAIADQLDQLAAQLNTDAKLKAYAKALLAAANAARAGNSAGLAAGIDAALGMKEDEYAGAPPDYGGNGTGSTSPGTWVGDHGKLNRSQKSTLLHLQFQDHYVSSQQGANGPETYTEETGPARLDTKSGIPYEAILPTYEKTAESALSKGNIPPEMRTKVRDYFDSLHQTQ